MIKMDKDKVKCLKEKLVKVNYDKFFNSHGDMEKELIKDFLDLSTEEKEIMTKWILDSEEFEKVVKPNGI